MTATDHRGELAQIPYPRGLGREQRAIFDQPGAANVHAGVDLVQDAERADLIEDKALAELEDASPTMRAIAAEHGRAVSNRLAGEEQARRDLASASAEVRDAGAGWAARHRANARAERAREAMTQPRGDDFVGVGQLSDTGYRRWVEHCAAGWGGPPHLLMDPDDLDMDAARDHAFGIEADDLHYRSPDLDDFDDDGM